MTQLPKRRKPQKMNVKALKARRNSSHQAWVRGFECAVAGKKEACEGPIQFAHVRGGTDGGTGLKPSDCWGIPLCACHHFLQHGMGEKEFQKQYGIDMKKIAAELAARSPHLKKLEKELEK